MSLVLTFRTIRIYAHVRTRARACLGGGADTTDTTAV